MVKRKKIISKVLYACIFIVALQCLTLAILFGLYSHVSETHIIKIGLLLVGLLYGLSYVYIAYKLTKVGVK